MAAVVRPELSTKNKYRVEKHRFYELKHFCLQYPIWKKKYAEIKVASSKPIDEITSSGRSGYSDPTGNQAADIAMYGDRIKLIESIAMVADPGLCDYILKGVTEDLSYTCLRTRHNIPCSRNTYYDRYRRFFWLLDVKKK